MISISYVISRHLRSLPGNLDLIVEEEKYHTSGTTWLEGIRFQCFYMSCGILTLVGCSSLYCSRFLMGSGRVGLSKHNKWETLAALILTHTGLAFNQAGSADTRIK